MGKKETSLHPKFTLDDSGNAWIVKEICLSPKHVIIINKSKNERDARESMLKGAKILIFKTRSSTKISWKANSL